MEGLQGIDRSKVLDVLVEALTGLAQDVPARSLRPWLDSPAGKQETRSDGGKAWRVSLQQNTPAARRLKYWRLPDSVIELDFVGHHDAGLD